MVSGGRGGGEDPGWPDHVPDGPQRVYGAGRLTIDNHHIVFIYIFYGRIHA